MEVETKEERDFIIEYLEAANGEWTKWFRDWELHAGRLFVIHWIQEDDATPYICSCWLEDMREAWGRYQAIVQDIEKYDDEPSAILSAVIYNEEEP
jgi:hypothetical protein